MYSDDDLKDVNKFKDSLHKEALKRINKIYPDIDKVIDKYKIDDFLEERWENPGAYYRYVCLPKGFESRDRFIEKLITDTIDHYKRRINYKEFGADNPETIIMLHGGGLSWWNFKNEAILLQDKYHVIIPILDGHNGASNDFKSIYDNAKKIIDFIKEELNGSVLCICGLSLGAQILIEILRINDEISKYAYIESASIIPSVITNLLIGPSMKMSYGLIKKEWFSKLQFNYLHINKEYYEDYYKDTSLISLENYISFLKASTTYKPELNKKINIKAKIIIGSHENQSIKRSAILLNDIFINSQIEIKNNLYHGQYSLNHPSKYVKDLIGFLK